MGYGTNPYYNAPGTAPSNINQLLWGVANGSDPQGLQVTAANDIFAAAKDPVYQQAAKALGITNINSQNDLDQLNRAIFGGGYANGAATAGANGNGGSGGPGGSGSLAGDNSGTLGGILGALGQQGQAGQNMAGRQLTEQEMLQQQLAAMQYQQQQATSMFQQQMAQQYMAQQMASQQMAMQMQQQQAMQGQQMAAMSAATQAAQSSAAEQQRQAEALARAYVPPVKETTGFTPFGDYRAGSSDARASSQLSELTFTSGAGMPGLANALILA